MSGGHIGELSKHVDLEAREVLEKWKGRGGKEQERKTAEIIQLDFWEDGKRAAPNAVLRSALFPVLDTKKERPFLKEEKLCSVSGVEVIFTGQQFDQSDLDIYLE